MSKSNKTGEIVSLASAPAGTVEFLAVDPSGRTKYIKELVSSIAQSLEKVSGTGRSQSVLQSLPDLEKSLEQLVSILVLLDGPSIENTLPKMFNEYKQSYKKQLEYFLSGTVKIFKDQDEDTLTNLEWRQLHRDVIDVRSILDSLLAHL